MNFEERVQEIILAKAEESSVWLAQQTEEAQQKIRGWVADMVASLSLELPISVKDILDKGGAVRQVVVKGREPVKYNHYDVVCREGGGGIEERFDLWELQGSHAVRFIIIAEPVEVPK